MDELCNHRVVCPVHRMRDCSPLLNGCSLVNHITNYVHDSETLATEVKALQAQAWDEGHEAGVWNSATARQSQREWKNPYRAATL